jgi:hypothetical protein
MRIPISHKDRLCVQILDGYKYQYAYIYPENSGKGQYLLKVRATQRLYTLSEIRKMWPIQMSGSTYAKKKIL